MHAQGNMWGMQAGWCLHTVLGLASNNCTNIQSPTWLSMWAKASSEK